MTEKRTTAAKETAAKRSTARKAAAPKKAAAPARAVVEPATPTAGAETCPRCGTAKFGPEQRIRAEGNRTVRYTILVCERGHEFARPVAR